MMIIREGGGLRREEKVRVIDGQVGEMISLSLPFCFLNNTYLESIQVLYARY